MNNVLKKLKKGVYSNSLCNNCIKFVICKIKSKNVVDCEYFEEKDRRSYPLCKNLGICLYRKSPYDNYCIGCKYYEGY